MRQLLSRLLIRTQLSTLTSQLPSYYRAMHFAANLSTLCEDISDIGHRYKHLANRSDFKFTAIECQNPYMKSLEEWDVIEKECGTPFKWVLINSVPIFDKDVDQFSMKEFDAVLEQTRNYAIKLKVSKVHLTLMDVKDETQRSKVIELLDYGVKYLHSDGIMVVIEPLSIRPNYYLRSYHFAQDILTKLNHTNLKIMLDTFHLQILHGNLTQMIEKLSPLTGHVQVSQVPLRDCPLADGEINHKYVLRQINKVYHDHVGLEFKNKSQESFSWLNEFK